MVLRKYGFDEIDNTHYKLQMYNPRTSTVINRKN